MPARRNVAPLFLALVAGVFLVWFSIPQLVGGTWLFFQENTLDRLAGGVPMALRPTPALFDQALVAWGRAAPELNNTQTWNQYGDVLVASANESDQNSAVRDRLLAAAAKAYRTAIERSPSNGRAWTMLAVVRVRLGATPEEIVNLLRMSLRTAPRDPPLVVARLDAAFYIWRVLPPDLRAQMAEQIRMATENEAWEFVQVVHRHYIIGPVRDILASDRDLQWTFDRAYMHFYP